MQSILASHTENQVLHVITAVLIICKQFSSLCDCMLLAHKAKSAKSACKVNISFKTVRSLIRHMVVGQ